MRKAILLICLLIVFVARPATGQQKKEIENTAEYYAYVGAVSQTDPPAKIRGLEAFLKEYPGSVMKEDALQVLMGAYQGVGNASRAQDAAQKILLLNPCDLRALALLAYTKQAMAQEGGDAAAQNLKDAGQYAEKGLACESTETKPEGISQHDFDKLKPQTAVIFNGASGVAAYQSKDYAEAQKRLRAAVNADPNSFVNVYMLALAYLQPGPAERDVDGLFYIARAANLAQGASKDHIAKYGKSRYTKYHGSDEGWDDLMYTAATATSPSGKDAGQNPAVASAGTITRIEGSAGTKNGGAAEDNRLSGSTARQPAGPRNVSLSGGGSASVRSNGQIRSISRNGMQISLGVHGGRTVVGVHNDDRVVNIGHHGGYVQRTYVKRGGRAYYSRTYYSHGVYRSVVYRGHYWDGHTYYVYYPRHRHRPAFYKWVYNRWPSRVTWSVRAWGWGGNWWSFYAGWWKPYQSYAGPAFWLTDYIIAQQLQSAYAAQEDAAADATADDQSPVDTDGGQVALTPEVKQAIADEVGAQLAAEQAEGEQDGGDRQAPVNNEVPPALDPARRTFVVDTALTVVSNDHECGLTSGDVITRLTDVPDAGNMVNASVSATKANDCAAGQTIAIDVADLQEMQNHFAEQFDSGLDELASKQGTGGMPKAPDTTTTASDVLPPQPDTTAGRALGDQEQAADRTESQVKQEVSSSGGQ
jgi:tetratricopeptide (TPR) repeat protein